MNQNITLVVNDCKREGAPIMSFRLRDCLLKHGQQVKIVALNGGPLEDNVDAVLLSPHEAAQQCFVWESESVLLCTLLVMQHVEKFREVCGKIQLVGVCHELYSEMFKWFDKAHFESFDSVIFVSSSSKRSFEPMSCTPEKLYVAPNWLDQKSICLLYTSPSPRDRQKSRMPSSA